MHIPKYFFLNNTILLETGKCFKTSIFKNLVSRSVCCFSICIIFPIFKLCLETKPVNRVSSGCGHLKAMAFTTTLSLAPGREPPMETLRLSKTIAISHRYISKIQFDLETVDEEPLCGYATLNSYLFIYLAT